MDNILLFFSLVKKKSSTSKRPTSPKKTATKPLRPAKRKSPKKSHDLLSPKDAEKSRDDPYDDPEQLYKASGYSISHKFILSDGLSVKMHHQ
jgi:hypothetical protein